MNLNLSDEQKQYLDKSGIIDATTLQIIFDRSIEDQEKLKNKLLKSALKRSRIQP